MQVPVLVSTYTMFRAMTLQKFADFLKKMIIFIYLFILIIILQANECYFLNFFSTNYSRVIEYKYITCENRLQPPDHSGVKIKMLARWELRISECWPSGNKPHKSTLQWNQRGSVTYVINQLTVVNTLGMGFI